MIRRFTRKMEDQMCHCGKPLHYTDEAIYHLIEGIVEKLGETIKVHAAGGVFLVPRHYIALHGIKASDVLGLGFEEIKK